MRRRSRPLVVALGLGCALAPSSACSDATLRLEAEPFDVGEGRVRLTVAQGGRALTLTRDGRTLLTLDERAFEVGVVDELAPDRSWDPWEIERRGDEDSGVTFRAPRRFAAAPGAPEREAEVRLDFGDGLAATLKIGAASASRFTLTLIPADTAPGRPAIALARVRLRTSGDPREGFYGLGEQVDAVDNRGKLRAMQMEADGEVESLSNEAHVPVPLLVGTRGWAVFAATTRVGTFDVARKDPSAIEATFAVAALAPGATRAEPLRVDLFAADAPLDLYREYFTASGAPKPPPAWALGPWIWRNEHRDQAEVEDDIAKIRELDLATSGIWIDRPYARAVNTFDFDAQRFPAPQAMIDRAHAAGLRVALWSAPYLEPAAEPMATEAKARGYYPLESGVPLNPWGLPIDFTGPAAAKFWRGLVERYTTMGVDGFKLDYGEDFVPSLGLKRNVWRLADGSDDRTMHHRYSGLYHRVYAEPDEPPRDARPETPFLLVRAARWGEQTLGVVVWPGDMDATFTQHKERFVNRRGEEIVGVGGLPATVVMGLSLSASGFPFFAADTGGYRHSPPDKELFVRWVEQTALSTVMEVGDASSQPPWLSTPENGRDAESLDVYRTYARLHARLFPYEWSYVVRMTRDGRPIQRPLGLAHPELGVHPSDEYLFGDELLVAPILARGQTRRRVVVPAGTWIDFWDGTPALPDREGAIEVDAPLEKLPLFLREGAIVPMLRPTVDTLAPASDPDVDSFARDAGPLWALVAPGPPRSFDLWDGARVARLPDGSFEVKDGAVFDRGFVLELIATREPAQVLRGEGAVTRVASPEVLARSSEGWTWTPERRGTLLVKLPNGDARVHVR
ncbi:MAG: glycoside hydrolase family 31 protein [Labilithrix sp.]|nr:glycoside hydrolase family 31 protein [Labilithrix sp.]